MSAPYTNFPNAVIDAFVNRSITLLKFEILLVMYRHAEHGAGIVKSWSAEVFLHEMHNHSMPTVRAVREATHELMIAGWFRWNYVKGSKKPYTVWFRVQGGQSGEGIQKSPQTEVASDAENGGCRDAECREDSSVNSEEQLASEINGHGNCRDIDFDDCRDQCREEVPINSQEQTTCETGDENECRDECRDIKPLKTNKGYGGSAENASPDTPRIESNAAESARRLMNSLTTITARELRRTRSVPNNLTSKFQTIIEAFGAAAVEEDFTNWCRENLKNGSEYPILDYIKVIDSRLGNVWIEPQADLKDPRIAGVSAAIYDETGFPPTKKSVANLLMSFSEEEIKAAVIEYNSKPGEKVSQSNMKSFLTEGGVVAVILAQRKRNEVSVTRKKPVNGGAKSASEVVPIPSESEASLTSAPNEAEVSKPEPVAESKPKPIVIRPGMDFAAELARSRIV
jgi:hypothetical protein